MSGSAEDAVRRRVQQERDKRNADERRRLAAERDASERGRRHQRAILDRIPAEVQAALERLSSQDYPGAKMFKVPMFRRISFFGLVRELAGWTVADIVVSVRNTGDTPPYEGRGDDIYMHRYYVLLSTGEIVSGTAETRVHRETVGWCRAWSRVPIQAEHAEEVLKGLLALASKP